MEQKIVSIEIFAQRFSEVFNSSNETTYTLGEKLSLSSGTISRYANGLMAPKIPTVYMMGDIFGVNPLWLMGYDVQKYKSPSLPANATPVDSDHFKRIPILGYISAGLPLYAEEHIEGYTATDLNGGAEYFALRVKGDSMNAIGVNEGYLIIVRRQDEVENGEVAVVMVGDEDATVKRFYATDTTVTLMPQSTNPIHQPQLYDVRKTPVKVLGKVVKVEFSL